MDYGVEFMVKKQKTLQRFWKYAVESIMNIAIICVDVRMARSNIFNSFALGHTLDSTTWSFSVVGYYGKEHVHTPIKFPVFTLRLIVIKKLKKRKKNAQLQFSEAKHFFDRKGQSSRIERLTLDSWQNCVQKYKVLFGRGF